MISKERLKLLEIFVLAQMLDLLSTLVVIFLFGGRELNPIMATGSIWRLSFVKIIAVLIITKTLINIKPKFRYLKIANVISAIPVFLNTFQLVLEVL
jgi:hypothetical protein